MVRARDHCDDVSTRGGSACSIRCNTNRTCPLVSPGWQAGRPLVRCVPASRPADWRHRAARKAWHTVGFAGHHGLGGRPSGNVTAASSRPPAQPPLACADNASAQLLTKIPVSRAVSVCRPYKFDRLTCKKELDRLNRGRAAMSKLPQQLCAISTADPAEVQTRRWQWSFWRIVCGNTLEEAVAYAGEDIRKKHVVVALFGRVPIEMPLTAAATM